MTRTELSDRLLETESGLSTLCAREAIVQLLSSMRRGEFSDVVQQLEKNLEPKPKDEHCGLGDPAKIIFTNERFLPCLLRLLGRDPKAQSQRLNEIIDKVLCTAVILDLQGMRGSDFGKKLSKEKIISHLRDECEVQAMEIVAKLGRIATKVAQYKRNIALIDRIVRVIGDALRKTMTAPTREIHKAARCLFEMHFV